MTDPEIIEWLFLLAPSNEQRKAIVAELLRHKSEDGMTAEDAYACRKGLLLLDEPRRVPEAAGPWLGVREEELIEL